MKKVKEPAPHVKAAQIEKEAVRALSEKEAETSIRETANKITDAFTKASKNAKGVMDAVITEEVRAKFDELDKLKAEITDAGEFEKEVEEALTKSTYGINEAADKIAEAFKSASKKAGEVVDAVVTDEVREKLDLLDELEPLDEDDNIIKDIEAENERLRIDNLHLRTTIKELRNVRTGMAECNKDIEVLKTECLDLKEEKNRLLREIDDYKKTISKMKYAHEEEVRALEDELAEAKVLGKKANEYSHLLDDDSCAFERILNLADTLKCQAEAIRGVVSLIENETEARV